MSDYVYKTEPYDHQRERFEAYRDRPYHAHLWDPRTGKTKVTLDTAAWMYEQGQIDAVHVIAPNGVHDNWCINEIPTHLPDRTRYSAFAYQTHKANTKAHQQALDRLLKHDGLAILSESYDGMVTDRGAHYALDFLTKRRVLQVVDEGHRIKSFDAKRTAYVVDSGKHSVRRRLLTGTLVGNDPFDVYCPLLFLDQGFWARNGFGGITSFKNHFAEWVSREKFTGRYGKGGQPIMQRFRIVADDENGEKKYRNLGQLNALLSSISDRVRAEDVLDMPPDVFEKRYYNISGEQRRIYEELRDEYITFVGAGEMVSAELAIVRLMRMQQVLCGYVPTDDGGDEPLYTIPGPNPRMECLMDTLEDIPRQGIIWARFRPDIDAICARLDKAGERYSRYDGKVPKGAARTQAVSDFQAGKTRWFVGMASMAGEGLPLFAADTVIYYSSTYKRIERIQSQDRPKVKGKKERIGIIDIVCPGTEDEKVIMALRSKQSVSDMVMGDRRKDWI